MILFNFSAHASAVYVSIFHLPSNCRAAAPAASMPQLTASSSSLSLSACVCLCWCCDCYRCREIFIQPPKYVMLFFRAAVAHSPFPIPHSPLPIAHRFECPIKVDDAADDDVPLSVVRVVFKFLDSWVVLAFIHPANAPLFTLPLSLARSLTLSVVHCSHFSCVRCGKLWQIHTLAWLTCRPRVQLFPWPGTMPIHAPDAGQADSVVYAADRPSAI